MAWATTTSGGGGDQGLGTRSLPPSRSKLARGLAALLLLLVVVPARPEEARPASDAPDPSAKMIVIQARHIKLWFAGKLGNWQLASYELDGIAASLEQATRSTPADAGLADLRATMGSLRKAVEARDVSAFNGAYAELTGACNACHRATGHGFISVQIPAVSPFTDQDFADPVAEGRKLAYAICGICHAVPDKPNVPLGMGFSAPSFADLAHRPTLDAAGLRRLLRSEHRRIGPEQAMPNPRLTENQIEDIAAYFESIRAAR